MRRSARDPLEPPARSSMAVVARRHSEEKIHAWRCETADRPRLWACRRRAPPAACAAARRADRHDEIRITVVREHRIGGGDDCVRSAGTSRRCALAIGHYGAVAARIDAIADSAVAKPNALAARAIDPLASERCQDASPLASAPAGPPSGPASAARPPRRAIATAALAAQPPLTTKNSSPPPCRRPAGILRREIPHRGR